MTDDREAMITFTVTREYSFSAPVADMARALGVGVREVRRMLDEGEMPEDLSDAAVTRLIRKADMDSDETEITDFQEC